jgi:YegS/Rv2252/BmrU family lipid kinase
MDIQRRERLLLIVNPRSGRGLSDSALGAVVGEFCGAGFEVDTRFTDARGAADPAAEYGAGYDRVVCTGGDGTLSEVISGLMRLPSPPPIGYIPTGTANDIANTLGLSRDPRVAARDIAHGSAIPLDVGRFGGEHFAYVAAFGAFTGASYLTPQDQKRRLGHLAYILSGLSEMRAIKPRHAVVEYDGGVADGSYVFGGVLNTLSVAGLAKLSPEDVSLSDGLFEVILVREPVSARELGGIAASILNKSYRSDGVCMLHTSRAVFTFDEDVAWTRDGEDGGVHRRVEILNAPRAVRIFPGGSGCLPAAGISDED